MEVNSLKGLMEIVERAEHVGDSIRGLGAQDHCAGIPDVPLPLSLTATEEWLELAHECCRKPLLARSRQLLGAKGIDTATIPAAVLEGPLVKIDDSQLYAIFAGLLDGEGRVEVTPKNSQADAYSVHVGLEVHDNHRGDSPDAVLHVAVTIDHPLLPQLKLRIPLPLEGEKAGIGAAIEDLTKFSERGHFLQRLPMLVVGGAGNPARQSQQMMIPAKFEIIQIPYRMLSDYERPRPENVARKT